ELRGFGPDRHEDPPEPLVTSTCIPSKDLPARALLLLKEILSTLSDLIRAAPWTPGLRTLHPRRALLLVELGCLAAMRSFKRLEIAGNLFALYRPGVEIPLPIVTAQFTQALDLTECLHPFSGHLH